MTRTRALIVAAVLAVAIAATAGITYTSATDDPDTAPAAATPATPTGSPTAVAPAAPEPTTPPAALRLGASTAASNGLARVTAIAYRQPVARSAPKPEDAPGHQWGAVDVRVCAATQDITVSRWPWVLTYADGSIVEPSSTGYDGFPRPEYPWGDQPVRSGRCVRGWIVYPVPADRRPAHVQYQPDGVDPVEWRIP